jgi:hypothetical protein
LEELEGKMIFTALDIRWGYHNIRIREEDQWKAAFKTPFGIFKPKVMFFGLSNSPPTFQRFMDRIFAPIKRRYPGLVFVYMDDILIATGADLELHRQIVHEVLELLESESLFCKLSKCHFEQRSITYLGIIVEQGTIRIDPTKVNGLLAWPRELKSVKQVRSTLGVYGYHQAFIPGYANIIRPLNDLLKKDTPFEWKPEHTEAMDQLAYAVSINPVLRRPDYEKPFFLEVDASQYATGAVLCQKDEQNRMRIVGSVSRSFNPAERNYDIHDRELLAIIHGLRAWRHLFLSSPHVITILTDHKNLTYYRHVQRITRRVARYLGELAEYNFVLQHKPGAQNQANGFSRRPDLETGERDNESVLVLPQRLFVQAVDILSIEGIVKEAQERSQEQIAKW